MMLTNLMVFAACEREMYAVSKRSRNDSSCETFSLTVRGKKNYELLSRIRDSLEMTEQLVPHGERDRYVQQRRQNEYVYVYTPLPLPPLFYKLYSYYCQTLSLTYYLRVMM